jgi:hypothetical protein
MPVIQGAVSVIGSSPWTMVARLYATIAAMICVIAVAARRWRPKKESQRDWNDRQW